MPLDFFLFLMCRRLPLIKGTNKALALMLADRDTFQPRTKLGQVFSYRANEICNAAAS